MKSKVRLVFDVTFEGSHVNKKQLLKELIGSKIIRYITSSEEGFRFVQNTSIAAMEEVKLKETH